MVTRRRGQPSRFVMKMAAFLTVVGLLALCLYGLQGYTSALAIAFATLTVAIFLYVLIWFLDPEDVWL